MHYYKKSISDVTENCNSVQRMIVLKTHTVTVGTDVVQPAQWDSEGIRNVYQCCNVTVSEKSMVKNRKIMRTG